MFYNETSAEKSEIVFECSTLFVEETNEIRENKNYIVPVIYGYGGHIQ